MTSGRVEPEVFAGAGTEPGPGGERVLDVEISGSFSAAELRPLESGGRRSRAAVEGDAETIDETVRENVPERVKADRPYKNVRFRRRLGACLRDPSREAIDGGA